MPPFFMPKKGVYIAIKKIPASIVAGIGGFTEVALFKAEAGAETAPEVNF